MLVLLRVPRRSRLVRRPVALTLDPTRRPAPCIRRMVLYVPLAYMVTLRLTRLSTAASLVNLLADGVILSVEVVEGKVVTLTANTFVVVVVVT